MTVTGQAPASPVTPVESPPVQAGCTEGATRVLQGEGDISTCENGQWHEGPYGYLQKPAAQPHGGWCDGNGSVEAIAPNGRSMFCVTGPDGAGSWSTGRSPQDAESPDLVAKQTTYEGLKTSCRRWHGDMTDIADQR